MTTPLILASRSPRRIELLAQLGLDVIVRPSCFNEESVELAEPESFVLTVAEGKGREVALRSQQDHPGAWLVSADTMVVLDGQLLGKPADAAEACAMLARLGGNWHEVFSGVCLFRGLELIHQFTARTRVRFVPLSVQQIADYVATGEPLDKAGAYGIQELGKKFIVAIEGDYYNVVGLPVHPLCAVLQNFAPHLPLRIPPKMIDRMPD